MLETLEGMTRVGTGRARLTGLKWSQVVAWCLVTIWALHLARGVFPVVPVDGDDQGVVSGVVAWQTGRADFAEVAYNFPIHPGSFYLVHGLSKAAAISPLHAFAALSALGAAFFLILSAVLICRLTGAASVGWVLLALMTVQEFVAAAYYANTSALAAPFVGLALWLGCGGSERWRYLAVGGLLGVAAWIRLDALLVSPVVFALALHRVARFRDAPSLTGLAATAAVGTVLTLFWLCDLPVAAALELFKQRDGGDDWSNLGRLGLLVASPVWLITSVGGLCALVWSRRWTTVLLCFTGVALTVAIYGRSFTTTKYFYFALPFAVLPGICLWLAAWRSGKPLARAVYWCLVGALLAESHVGVRTSSATYRRFDTSPTGGSVSFMLFGKQLQLGFQEGEIIPTHDGFRLRGAALHAPVVWQRLKREAEEDLRRIDEWLARPGCEAVVCTTYLSWQVVGGVFVREGYRRIARQAMPSQSGSSTDEWDTGQRCILVYKINDTAHQQEELRSLALAPGTLFVNDRGQHAATHLGIHEPAWKLETAGANALISLWKKR